MKKNLLITVMVVLIVLVGFGSFLAGKKQAEGVELGAETGAAQTGYVGYAEYAGIYMLKDLFPYPVYKECVLPHAQKLFVQEKISKQDFAIFEQNVEKSLNEKGYSVRQLISDYAREESLSDSFQSNIDKFNEDAMKMGNGMKQGLENLMKGLTEEPTKQPRGKMPQSLEL